MKSFHLICNSHIDYIWQWLEDEGNSASIATFYSAVNLLKKYDYIFCHNEAILYEFIENNDRELFDKISKLVKQGKWNIMGGWYLQPDCNMPSGESLVRQILVGKDYFLSKFGCFPKTAINFDPFGHSNGIVQLVKKCGQANYIITRPNKNQLSLPDDVFIWVGVDGSRINVLRCPQYATIPGRAREYIEYAIEEQRDKSVGIKLWGVGNHGGGPSDKDLSDIKKLQADSSVEIKHSTPDAFFCEVEIGETYKKSLNPCMPGCYTSMIRLKQKHIELESLLYSTEKMLSITSINNLMVYPSKEIEEVTKLLLKSEFHDTLTGTIIKEAEEKTINDLCAGISILTKLKTQAMMALAVLKQKANPYEYPIYVYNCHPYAYYENIECEVSVISDLEENMTTEFDVYDEDGNKIDCQIVKEGSNINLDWRKRLVFSVLLKPMQLTKVTAVTKKVRVKPKTVCKNNIIFKNQDKYVEIDVNTGLLKSYNIGGVEYIKEPSFSPYVYHDSVDPWAMSDAELKKIGTKPKKMPLANDAKGVFGGCESVNIIEDGDIYLGVESLFSNGSSKVRVEYKIYKNNNYVDVNVKVYWNEIDRMLKLHVNTLGNGKYIGQIPYGTSDLYMDGRECVAQRFVALKQKDKKCFAIFNKSIYGSSYKKGKIMLSMLRSPVYCAHPIGDKPIIREDRFIPRMDQGETDYSFRMAVLNENELETKSLEFVQNPYALNFYPSNDIEKDTIKNCVVSNKTVALSVFKKADNFNGYIIRLFNNSNDKTETTISIGSDKAKLKLKKYEVVTVCYYKNKFVRKNIMEI